MNDLSPHPALRRVPQPLEALISLALNLRWTWYHGADALWETMAPEAWAATRNPWQILQMVSRRRLDALAVDADYLRMVAEVAAEQQAYLERGTTAAAAGGGAQAGLPKVAYFCLEYGLAEALPLYSGGLGLLAGDLLKTASDIGLPMVGVGLLYQQGFFRQMVDADGRQGEFYPPNVPIDLPIAPALDSDGEWLTLGLQLPGRELILRVWQAQVGCVPLYLLDSNHPTNSPVDRGITNALYPANNETRFLQEIVLGIGGWRTLRELEIEPDVCHLNEGHAALVTLERARVYMRRHDVGFDEALWATRAGNVFTTHTPVAAAFDTFPVDMVRKYGRIYANALGMEDDALLGLARADAGRQDAPFNMTYLALRTCGAVNAVSRTHADVSRALLQHLYPRRPLQEVPVGYVTNGVHMPSWDSRWADRMWTEACGKPRWSGSVEDLTTAIERSGDHVLWSLKGAQRQDLVAFVRRRLQRQIGQRGVDGGAIDAAAHVLDPNALTMCFARRFTAYKRPNLLLRDTGRLERLLTNADRPVQLVVAGKAHPNDLEGKNFIREWALFAQRPAVRDRVVFLEDYDIDIAQHLVQGADLWINTPSRPWEACGTSGMKVLVNGGLNLSERDGWWAEAYDPSVGWAIESGAPTVEATDQAEAEQLYTLLENDIVPMFYTRNDDGIPAAWLEKVRASMANLTPRFSSNRMLGEYLERYYRPAAETRRRRCAESGQLARDLQAWGTRVTTGWHHVRFGNVERWREGNEWVFKAQVYLGDIEPDDVIVELYADPATGQPATICAMQRGPAIDGTVNGWHYDSRVRSDRPACDFTPRIQPHHAQAAVPLELGLLHWWQGQTGAVPS